MELLLGRIDTPIGEMLAVCRGESLCALEFADHGESMMDALKARFGAFRLVERSDPAGACSRLQAYFSGALDAPAELAIDAGGTDFQKNEWRALRAIRPGEIVTYAGLAARLGTPKAVRAVARANALNPVNIAIPCHRVIGADGSLRGYSGGLERKRWLLEHEGVRLEARQARKPPTF